VRLVNMRKSAFFALLMAVPAASPAQNTAVTGNVFVDANANGTRDRDERGLSGVVVSNQDSVVVTGSAGEFRIARGANSLVFVSVPDGYRSIGQFWRTVSDTTKAVDFALSPVHRSTTFTFIHASDTHIAPAVLARTQRFRALADSINPSFVIISGDLVRDALRVGEAEATSYYEMFAGEAAKFHNPVWTVPGNHENFGVETAKSKVSSNHPLFGRRMYHHFRGPDYYSFNLGGVHFVGLNSVDIDGQWYYGHVDSVQLAWLERDLAMIPKSMPVVTFNHIPFFSTSEQLSGYSDDPPAPTLITINGKTTFRHTVSNAAEVLAALRKSHHVLALGGHIHAGEHITFEVNGAKIPFNQTAAIVGRRASAGMQFPSGFTLYTVRNGVVDSGRFVPLNIDK
jgi:hypothetical protein